MATVQATKPRTFWDFTGYQWAVLLAAWLGWGFDVFDGLLFNYVAPVCVPTLLHIPLNTPEAKSASLLWTGILSSLLLVGWGLGGIIFGRICDRIGRSRTLLLTMGMFAVGTALCATAQNMAMLVIFRFIASLGIGGEWAAGAAMVAEIVPEKRRVEAGALLYTSSPAGLFLATFLVYLIQGHAFKSNPEVGWRYVFLCGLIPAGVALIVRMYVKEPERWKSAKEKANPPRISELFSPALRAVTLGGFGMALVALIMWWSCNAFIPTMATDLAQTTAAAQHLAKDATQGLVESWKALATNCFNLGGLIGTLLTIPAAKYLGRKKMFFIYFLASAISLFCAFGLDMPAHTRLYMYFPIGLSIFGVFGSFTFYLPELFPTRLRATGAGFCYNAGRFVAAFGPFIVGSIAQRGASGLSAAMTVLTWVAVVPLIGILIIPFIQETRGRELAD